MSTQQTPAPSVLSILVTSRQQVAIGLALIGVILAGLAIWFGVWGFSSAPEKSPAATPDKVIPAELEKPADDKKADAKPLHSPDYRIACIWAGGLALLTLLSALWIFTQPPDPAAPITAARKEVLAYGGTAGFLTVMAGAFLGYSWRDSIASWIGGTDSREAKWLFYSGAIFLVGLLIMFLSLQLARSEQRANAALRRVLYGFNSVFVGLLLLLVLIVVNVFAFVRVPNTLVTNDSAFTSLSEESKKFLRSLDRPVHVYLILPESHVVSIGRVVNYTSLYSDCRGLLSQCEDESRNFHAVYLSPAFDKERIAALMQRLNVREADREQLGLLITVGEDESAYTLIPDLELVDVQRREGSIVFQGENKLMTELMFLTDARGKEKIYFTQGHGELGIDPAADSSRTMAEIVRYLRDRKMTVEALDLTQPDAKVPDDAAVVVVAGPRQTFAEEKVNVLRNFVRRTEKPGKLLLFLPAFRAVDGKVAPSGLEGLARELGVEVEGRYRIVSAPRQAQFQERRFMPQDCVLVAPFPRIEGSLARTFGKAPMIFQDAREVKPLEGPPVPSRRVTPLLGTGLVTWQEDNFREDLILMYERLLNSKDGELIAQKKVKTRGQAFVMAVAVLETSRDGDKTIEKPRALVFGSDSILIDQPPTPAGIDEIRQQMVSDSLDWLREREASIGVTPRKLPVFILEKRVEWSSQFVLLLMIAMGIAVVGGGVWLSRRR